MILLIMKAPKIEKDLFYAWKYSYLPLVNLLRVKHSESNVDTSKQTVSTRDTKPIK